MKKGKDYDSNLTTCFVEFVETNVKMLFRELGGSANHRHQSEILRMKTTAMCNLVRLQ